MEDKELLQESRLIYIYQTEHIIIQFSILTIYLFIGGHKHVQMVARST